MYRVTISEKGQIVIPAALRSKYGWRRGDRLLVTEQDGRLVLEPLSPQGFLKLQGAFRGGSSLTAALLRERAADRRRGK
ncbi:MAG: AbrB/MazE/SpoVT family DNA-binding domain-containing protein [Bacillota bacterium]|nr:AbrB/MazE/SpoVT family DNA-binding domain-containing protein [Bacillota bacterium]